MADSSSFVSTESTALVGTPAAPHKFSVLVVDDESKNCEFLSRFLNKEGYEARAASNGAEALQKINESAPDLILLDLLMPVMNGWTVCEKLKADIRTQAIPIILLTALNSFEDRLKGLRAGVDDYIGKPFEFDEVKARVDGILRRRRSDRASHPLTGLPGSPAIEEEVWRRLRAGTGFGFAYIDIDNFKTYNDVYGYDAGDRVIKTVASLLTKETLASAEAEPAFAGHIGGDDFILLSSESHLKTALVGLSDNFDAKRSTFYHAADFERGMIRAKNRQGHEKDFPLMALSVAVVSTSTRRILHYARLVEIVSELKRFTKAQPHGGRSLVLWDRRTDILREGGYV